jgi:hypothetical protein
MTVARRLGGAERSVVPAAALVEVAVLVQGPVGVGEQIGES